jgi:hypothetical protein
MCVCLPGMRVIVGKAIPIHASTDNWLSRRLKLSRFLYNRHMKVAMLSGPRTGRGCVCVCVCVRDRERERVSE